MTKDARREMAEILGIDEIPERLPITSITEFLGSWGSVREEAKETRSRALAAYLRSLLQDTQIKRYIELTQEARYLSVVRDEFLNNPELSRLILLTTRSTLEDSLKAIGKEMKSLRAGNADKFSVIDEIAATAKRLGCQEEFVLPKPNPEYPTI